ncbi:hypothetical protein C0J52_25170 [Blattella germanica]|nr:hypothetical protein C0J52_25170 [Blattella germanica]
MDCLLYSHAPKKKLSKKEKQKLAAEKAEQERIEMEKERQRLIQEEKERVERERLEAEEKAKRDVAEQNVRVIQLQATIALFKSYGKKMYKLKLENRANEEWIQYLKCDGLPDPASLGEMNTYLYLWRNCEERGILEDVVRRTGETLGLLEAMQELIDIPLNNTPEHVENWIQVCNDFRKEQQISLDRATYLILRRIEEKMNITNVSEVHYLSKFDHFILCLWSILPLPTPSVPLPKSERQCAFTEVGVNISLPDSLFDVLLAVRAMLVRYDHLSDLCPSWFPCPLPEDELKDLYEISLLEWEARCEFQVIVDEENERRAQIAARVAAIKPVSTQEDSRRAKKDKDKLLAQTAALEAEKTAVE